MMSNNRKKLFVRIALIFSVVFVGLLVDAVIVKRRSEYKLMSAVYIGDYEQAHVLLESGVDVNCSNLSGTTPLIIATLHRDHRILSMLLQYRATVTQKDRKALDAFYYSVYEDDLYAVKQLIERGASINRGYVGNTNALMLSVYRHNLPMLKLLLSHGADVNARSKHGMTALWLAERFGEKEAVILLKRAGATNSTL